MLHSMTGFARDSSESPIGTLTWELRAVNHRYLDVQFKLPDELRPQEQAFRQIVAGRLKRGKVEAACHFRRQFDDATELELNRELVDVLAKRLGEIADRLDDDADVDPMDVLRWPGVIRQAEIDTGPLAEAATELLSRAVDAMAEMRASEGGRIAEMIETRCAEILTIADSVRARMPAVLEASRQKQRDRLDKFDVEADPERLEVELALIAQKLDVDEEIDRLASHVEEIRTTLAKDEPVGRRLDFLMQELNREANTLGSKSGDAETTKAAVDLKVLIEQMREQIQNIE
ncbi:MAG: YicC/YloC family endoribonuclease [Woeseiaceae bacterium]|nr:YicC/YloC family endoribonuclease [Woeseiaceae bacterium]